MLFANYLTDTNEALLFLSYAIINQPKLNLQERPAAGAGARSAWGRASAPTSASRASARNAADRRYASMTAEGASARSAWGRASAPTSAARASARNAADRRYASMTARHEVSAAEQGAARGAKESVLIGQDRHKRINNPQADFRTGRSRSRDRDVSKGRGSGASFMHARDGLANRDRRYLAWSARLAC
jgi:hypothetical protein